jgi:type IV secretory pathway TraG/TraD family ATPase VirD4
MLSLMELGLRTYINPNTREILEQIPIYNTRRFQHTWVIGKTGTGKSTTLERWAIDDILAGEGLAFFDPHGDAADTILLHIPPHRRRDVMLFDPSDRDFPIGFNIFHNVPIHRRPFVASSVVDCFKSIWGHSWGPQLEMFLYAGAAALLDVPDGTLLGLKFLITSPTYRKRVLSHIQDPAIKDFWETDFEEHMPEREQRERTLSTLNKIGALISDPTIRNAIGQPTTSINFKDIMDNQKILIVSLPQGKLGIEKSALIGALLMSHLHLTALSGTRTPFHVYADECHHFGTQTLVEMLSGIRKFGVSLVLAHQYLGQLTPALRDALIGTVGTIVAFRLGVTDSKLLAPEIGQSLHDLAPYTASVRTDETYTLDMPPISSPIYPSSPRRIRHRCRSQYAMPREHVETRIARFIQNT